MWDRIQDFADWMDGYTATPYIALAACAALVAFGLWIGGLQW